MQPEDIIIHIQWDGPHTFEQVVSKFNDPTTHKGIYAIYGGHPVYGNDTLLYIGLTIEHFAARLGSGHGWHHWNQNAGRLSVDIGRFIGLEGADENWNQRIAWAERLLIHAHQPALNSQKDLRSLEPELRYVHVLNWARHRSLLPEVSGARWTKRFDEDVPWSSFYKEVSLGQSTKTETVT